jgi:membrane protein YdbS with pleckstrin-like domain
LIDATTSVDNAGDSQRVTVIRIVCSFFVLLVIVIAIAGWLWTTQHQPPAQAFASHVVLAASALASCGGLCAVWRRPRDPGQIPD